MDSTFCVGLFCCTFPVVPFLLYILYVVPFLLVRCLREIRSVRLLFD